MMENKNFVKNFMEIKTHFQCMAENDCFPEVPPDGYCLAS